MHDKRLEIIPSRENPEHLDAIFRKRLEIGFDLFGSPIAPHVRASVARPIVAPDEEPAAKLENRQ